MAFRVMAFRVMSENHINLTSFTSGYINPITQHNLLQRFSIHRYVISKLFLIDNYRAFQQEWAVFVPVQHGCTAWLPDWVHHTDELREFPLCSAPTLRTEKSLKTTRRQQTRQVVVDDGALSLSRTYASCSSVRRLVARSPTITGGLIGSDKFT